ncbi:MAG: GTP 3',8-cyclase MoaA [Candidatus Methanoperedens sp.]|nr:GTP 3',8-cyclase MoaA [Candidatus Methanoperedens sp.]MCE8424154.1 GTP 3',8-cyclase MoaA [Candidatus Methanoperedens sp.]MCE8428286.1 GTP 3',8-cyclase MoaA [Candidatus Methanoperedens sp.]
MISDNYGRVVTGLRISITRRCNLNCIYCHEEGENGLSRNEISQSTIERTVTAATYLGVNKVKFSGGEPLMRHDLEDIIGSLPDLKDISATTNGVLLKKRAAKLANSGLDRINISLPSMDMDHYGRITGYPTALPYVLEGIDAAVDAGLTPVKLNMVLLKSLNDSKIDDIIRFAGKYNGHVILQLIELMNFKNLGHYKVDINGVEKMLEIRASEIKERRMHRRKKYFIDGVEVELVRPLDNSNFCGNCNRLRITSTGQLKPCLMRNDNLIDIPENATVDELKKLLETVVEKREPYYKDCSK